MTDTDNRPVSPVNGQPLPRGKPFTSESAREARRKRAVIEQENRSIVKEFRRRMSQEFTDDKGNKMTGAEIIAQSIIKGANNGNAKMVEIALELMGEKPADNINVSFADPNIMAEIRKRMESEDA